MAKKEISSKWLYLIFVLVLISFAVFMGWNYWQKGNTDTSAPEVTQTGIDSDLSSIDKQLDGLSKNIDQIDPANTADDNAPNL